MNTEVSRIAGDLKATPEDFVVEEIPLYEPSGAGEHVYIRVVREGMTTQELIQALARELQLNPRDIGYAGLKDKQALTTQWLSLHMNHDQEAALQKIRGESHPWQILECRRHENKLKRGHLCGNQFKIRVRTQDPEALPKARSIADLLLKQGVPNYFGDQRFGNRGDNAAAGRHLLQRGRPARGWRDRLLLSAYQAELFNRWLGARIERGDFQKMILGDVAKKTDTGGLFIVEDLTAEQARFEAGEIGYTGPIYGSKLKPAAEEAAVIETELLAAEALKLDDFRRVKLAGSRRMAVLFPEEIQIEAFKEGLYFAFSLPKGSYATVLLREFLISLRN